MRIGVASKLQVEVKGRRKERGGVPRRRGQRVCTSLRKGNKCGSRGGEKQ